MSKMHALLVSDEEINFIVSMLSKEYVHFSEVVFNNSKRAKILFQNLWSFNYDDFFNRCEDVLNLFREESFK